MSPTKPTAGIQPVGSDGARRTPIGTTDIHHDGGRLRAGTVSHRHVVEHDDGTVSAVVVRGVPAVVCELCEQTYYEPEVTDTIVAVLQTVDVEAGEATAVDYPTTAEVA